MSRVVDSQAFVAGSGVSLTRIPEEKRRALDGFEYTFSEFLSYYGYRLAYEKWRKATKIQILDVTSVDSLEEYDSCGLNIDPVVQTEFPVGESIAESVCFEFDIQLRKQVGKPLGCDVAWDPRARNFAILSIHSEGLLPDWNRDHSDLAVFVNDRVVQVNDHNGAEGGSELSMFAEVQYADKLEVRIYRPPSLEKLPECGWQYMDPYDTVQGPFSRLQMRVWSTRGCFDSDLPIRFAPNDDFRPLKELFPEGTAPFVTAVVRHQESSEGVSEEIEFVAEDHLEQPNEGAKYCNDCKMWLNGPQQFEDHVIGKKHKNNVKKLEAMSKAVVKPKAEAMSKAVPKKVPPVVPTEPREVEIPEKRAFPSSHTDANALKYQ